MIFDWLFKRSKKSNNKEAIAPIFIHVPTREDLINDGKTEELELLDKFKKEYKERLNRKLLVGNISSEDLSKLYLDNQNIIIKHIMDNTYRNVDEILAKGNINELLETKLEYLGLYILSEENSRLYKEIELRYTALSEIKKKTYFIKPIQRRAIMNELDFLYSSLIICRSNSFVTDANSRLYLIRMNEINKYLSNLGNEETDLLNEKKILVTKLANTFIKDKYDSVINSNMLDLGIVSYLKIELEKYYLKHKNEFESLDDDLDKLDGLEINSNNREELLKQIEVLESKYLLLKMLCIDVKINLKKLYNNKFNILTNSINIFDKPVISRKDYGYEFYRNFVQAKINNLLSGENRTFNVSFASISYKSSIVNDYFINADEVLNSMEKLAVLLSFDRVNGFSDLLNNTLIRKDDLCAISLIGTINYMRFYKSLFDGNNQYGITWSEYIPLKSVLEIIRRREPRDTLKPLTMLYNLSDLIYLQNKLPDGIIKMAPARLINNGLYPIAGPKNYNANWLNNWSGSKPFTYKIELPKTLKEYAVYYMNYYSVEELPFGIEKVLFNINYDIPPIPPTVNEIKLLTNGYKRDAGNRNPLAWHPLELSFLDYKNSAFLRNKEKFVDLLNNLNETTMIFQNDGIKINLYSGGLNKTIIIHHKSYYGDSCTVSEGDNPNYLDNFYKYHDSYYDDFDSIYDEKIKPKLNYVLDEEQVENKPKIKKKIC